MLIELCDLIILNHKIIKKIFSAASGLATFASFVRKKAFCHGNAISPQNGCFHFSTFKLIAFVDTYRL